MRIAITGAAGCLGSNLIEHWLPHGHEILALDNFATGRREVLPPIAGLRTIEGSVSDAAALQAAFKAFRPEVVIHSAAAYKDPANWREDVATNVQGAVNVARASEEVGVRRLVNFQTALCYGRPREVPIPVDHPTAPFTSYGVSKTAGEQYLRMASVPVISLRIANVTAPRLSIGPIPTFFRRLKAGQPCFCSDTVRDFLDIADFTVLMDLALRDTSPVGVFNVSTGEGHSMKEVFDEVAAYLEVRLEKPVPIVPAGADDVRAVVLDPTATEEAFGWKARIGFRELIRRQLDWYSAHGVSEVHSHLAAPKMPA